MDKLSFLDGSVLTGITANIILVVGGFIKTMSRIAVLETSIHFIREEIKSHKH